MLKETWESGESQDTNVIAQILQIKEQLRTGDDGFNSTEYGESSS